MKRLAKITDKKGLIGIVDGELKPIGLKRKSLICKSESGELLKQVDLQRSRLSNLYYLNYDLPLRSFNSSKTGDLEVKIFCRLKRHLGNQQ